MLDLIGKATFINYFPQPLVVAIIFIFFIGYIYGYSVSYLFGIKKTFTIGFFVVILTAILILISSFGYLFTVRCSFLLDSRLCPEELAIFMRFASILVLLLSHFFINIFIGHFGVILGVISYLPSEWFLKKYTGFSSIKKSVSESENIEALSTQLTMGTKKLG